MGNKEEYPINEDFWRSVPVKPMPDILKAIAGPESIRLPNYPVNIDELDDSKWIYSISSIPDKEDNPQC